MGGGGVKPPEPLRKKNNFSMIFKNCPEPNETQEKLIKKLHVTYYVQCWKILIEQKKVMKKFCKVSENIIFSNLNLTEIFK